MSNSDTVHVPVLPAEVTEWLAPKPGSVLIDGTFGGGGHARLLAQLVGDDGLLIGCDRDPKVIEKAESSGSFSGLPIKMAEVSYREIPDLLKDLQIEHVDGILLDLGLSSDQLAEAIL